MITRTCGCTTATCGCCEGTETLTPMPTANRPGLSSLAYRVGTHGAFLETMRARLASMAVRGPGPDGQTIETFLPLQKLTTRDPGDPAIALLDGWATVADVLTFYQQLIANEGYLRTASERQSVLELARLVGYTLRPGVASTVYLAYTLDDHQTDPVEIPIRARTQSIPGPGELPQSFETVEKIVARSEWNNLQVRLTQPQKITADNALTVPSAFVGGTSTNLKAGDLLLLDFGDDKPVVRTVAEVKPQFGDEHTELKLQPTGSTSAVVAALEEFVGQAATDLAPTSEAQRVVDEAKRIIRQARLGLRLAPEDWTSALKDALSETLPTVLNAPIEDLVVALDQAMTAGENTSTTTTDPSEFVNSLLRDPNPQARNSLRLTRNPKELLGEGSETHPQLLVNLAPRLRPTFYTAWAKANLETDPPAIKAVYAFRVSAPLFGSSASKIPTYYTPAEAEGSGGAVQAGDLKPPYAWYDWPVDGETTTRLFLDQPHEGILPGSYVFIQTQTPTGLKACVKRVAEATTVQRSAYGISGKTTRLTFKDNWWTQSGVKMENLRATIVHAQSEPLTLVEQPLTEPVTAGTETRTIELAGLHKELRSGRWVIFSGERADIPGVSGVKVSELLMISAVSHGLHKDLPGDKIHTTLTLATPTAYSYDRNKFTIYGNVVKATHGETRHETLGSGDGAKARQAFELKQPPLTFVPAPTPSGVESTLEVYVNDVQWHEADTLAGRGPTDRVFVTKTDDEAKTTVVFGNGQQGSRLPTGAENVKAVYRNGIGKPGNVLAEQISMLQTRPLGVKSVINPLRGSGGADKEDRDQGRENVPLAVMALDRIVSVQDYADFTRTFAGIGKAQARQVSNGHYELVHLTVAGADDIPIDVESDLYRNLLAALRRYGDPDLPIEVQMRELIVLVINAKVRLASDYQWEPVATAVRAALLDTFGFAKRSLGQPALLCEVIGCIQNVEGVAWVDVDAFGGLPEKTVDKGTRRLLTLEELAEAAAKIVNPGQYSDTRPDTGEPSTTPPAPYPADRVDANVAGFEGGALRPAQLAIAIPTVPDTIVLNPIEELA
jgi:predicted phage baseplate assembly protein